jgi:hypothetical protein
MSYYFSKTLPVGFDEAVRRTTEVLKRETTIEFSARAIRSSHTRRYS